MLAGGFDLIYDQSALKYFAVKVGQSFVVVVSGFNRLGKSAYTPILARWCYITLGL